MTTKELTGKWYELVKDLKILNIIRKKLVDMSWLAYSLTTTSSLKKALSVYNDKNIGNIPLTLKEISILNQWLS